MFYKELIQNSPIGYAYHKIICNKEGIPIDYEFLEINSTFEKLTGLSAFKVVGHSFRELFEDIDSDELLWISIYGEVALNCMHKNFTKYSSILHKWYKVYVFSNKKGYFITFFSDVSEEIIKMQKYKILINSIEDIIFEFDNNYAFMDVYFTDEKFLFMPKEKFMGKRINEVLDEEISNLFINAFKKVLDTKKSINIQYKSPLKDDIRWFNAKIFTDNQDTFISVISDITEKKLKDEEMCYLSYHDVLTGLYNRRFFEEELKRLNTERQLPISIIMGDVNGLKLTNDVFGHAEGDKVLCIVANCFKSSCRKEDIIARWGGDEFVILLPQTPLKATEEICKKIYSSCRKEKNSIIKVSISLGFSIKESGEQDINSILKKAEQLMYENKTLEGWNFKNEALNSIKNNLYNNIPYLRKDEEKLNNLINKIQSKFNLSNTDKILLHNIVNLHDVGNIAIDADIINKPTKLNESEWEIIKTHSEIGYRIIKYIPEFSNISEYILNHHEHFDGSGYPKGLKGDNIPYISKIFSVLNAYIAMTSERPYRKPLSENEAKNEIKRNMGKQFDPKVCNIFLGEL